MSPRSDDLTVLNHSRRPRRALPDVGAAAEMECLIIWGGSPSLGLRPRATFYRPIRGLSGFRDGLLALFFVHLLREGPTPRTHARKYYRAPSSHRA